jgi:FAD/FMN-containing dehydrogenase
MDKLSPPIQEIADLLSLEEVVTSSSPSYLQLTRTWAAQKNLEPHLVVQPKDLNSLSRLVALLGKSELDFAVRSAGFGSASAKDILVSMSAFGSFEFDRQNEVITIGAGQTFAEVDAKMGQFASGMQVQRQVLLQIFFPNILISY